MKTEDFGIRFLEPHTRTEQKLNLDDQHSIVDKKDLFSVIDFFRVNPDIVDQFSKFSSGYHLKLASDSKKLEKLR